MRRRSSPTGICRALPSEHRLQLLDLTAELAAFFASGDRRRAACHVPAEIDGCPGEKDTGEGREKGSDLGLGKCDFVEFANVA